MTEITVSQTIADQIGSRAFYMLGASKKPIIAIENGISFGVGRNAKRVTHVRVVLTPDDLYTLEFLNCNARRAETVKTLTTVEGVYADHLRTVIEAETGLATSL